MSAFDICPNCIRCGAIIPLLHTPGHPLSAVADTYQGRTGYSHGLHLEASRASDGDTGTTTEQAQHQAVHETTRVGKHRRASWWRR